MRIDQLLYFVTVVESSSYLEASEKLNLSQSALSKMIMRLEETLDVKLFNRTTRHVTLTAVGELVYRDAKKILEEYDILIGDVRAFQKASNQIISFGTLPGLLMSDFAKRFKSFYDTHPNAQITISEEEDSQLLELLVKKQLDMAILRKEILSDDSFHFYPLITDKLVLVVSVSNPLASKNEADLSKLNHETFIFPKTTSSLYTTCTNACIDSGFTPRILMTGGAESILASVGSDLGISLLMESMTLNIDLDELCVIPLTQDFNSTIGIAVSKKGILSLYAQNLIASLCHNMDY